MINIYELLIYCCLVNDVFLIFFCCFFFFKQKTAYEMRISDWSSDVCSSDLAKFPDLQRLVLRLLEQFDHALAAFQLTAGSVVKVGGEQIGRASCRERVCQYV